MWLNLLILNGDTSCDNGTSRASSDSIWPTTGANLNPWPVKKHWINEYMRDMQHAMWHAYCSSFQIKEHSITIVSNIKWTLKV